MRSLALSSGSGSKSSEIDDVMMGGPLGDGTTGAKVTRQIVLRAGLPLDLETEGMTVNRYCSTGLQTIAEGASRTIMNAARVGRGRRCGVDFAGTERACHHLHGAGAVAARGQARDLHDDDRDC
jgi:acetyl-CoA C-acetyltransferase